MDIKTFKGLNNVTDPLRLGMAWLVKADNVVVTDAGAIEKREGYTLSRAGSFSAAYTTKDFSRMYLTTPIGIQTFTGENIYVLSSTEPMYWAEVNDYVYFNNGTDSGVIAPDNSVAPWRDAPVSDGAGFKGDDGEDLDVLFGTLPVGADVIQFWGGRMYAAQYFPGMNQTAVWVSEPMGFHLFNLDSGFFLMPGRVLMLAPHDKALIVGTDSHIYAYDGQKLDDLADYGVVPGQHWAEDNDQTYFWTARGVCSALPFTNLTEKQISVAPGLRAGGCIVNSGGQKRYVAVLQQGGVPFNAL